MQSYAVVVLVVVATVFGHVDARVASGISATNREYNFALLECPYKTTPNYVSTTLFNMLNNMVACHQPSAAFLRRIDAAPDTDAYRRILQSACTQVPAVKTCVAVVDSDANVCLSNVERKMWTTLLDYLDTCIAAMCADDSEVLATMLGDEFKAMSEGSQQRVWNCMDYSSRLTLFGINEADLPTYTLRKYRGIKEGQKCVLDVAKDGGISADRFKAFMDKIVENMKCLTPATYEIVPCEKLEADEAV